jgi:hypothetical protein
MRIHLKRILGVGVMGIDVGFTGMPLKLVREQALDQRLDCRLPEMKQVPRIVEGEPVFHVRTAQPSDLAFPLQNLVGHPRK